MKQFTRCTNCRQWYVQEFTVLVEICQAEYLRRHTVWCLQCIDAAERRSHLTTPAGTALASSPALQPVSSDLRPPASSLPAGMAQLVQEHLDLMDRAMRDDDAMLIPLIEDFIQRCRTYTQQASEEDTRRLIGQLQYWEAFMRAWSRS